LRNPFIQPALHICWEKEFCRSLQESSAATGILRECAVSSAPTFKHTTFTRIASALLRIDPGMLSKTDAPVW
jgi:hypothetical protein